MDEVQKVYIAVKGWDYEGFDVMGVYLDVKDARAKIDESHLADYVEIQVFTLNGERLLDDPDEYRQEY